MATNKYRNLTFSTGNSTADKFEAHCSTYMVNKSEIGRTLIEAYMRAPDNMLPSERLKKVMEVFSEEK